MQDLLTLVPGDAAASSAQDINLWGLIVGQSDVLSVAGRHAVLWKGGRIVNLNSLIDDPSWTLVNATAVNDRGDIVGTGYVEGVGANQVFILRHYDAAPEPGIGAGLATAIAALAWLRGPRPFAS